jgi:hypothetical protein
MMPRTEVARPTVAAGMPRPPVKIHGRDSTAVSLGVDRGLDRKRVHRLAKAPSWKSNRASATRVNITFRVHTRANGRVLVRFGFGSVATTGLFSELLCVDGESGALKASS